MALQPRAEDAHRALSVLPLRTFRLTRDDETRRDVRDANGGVRRVDVLSAGSLRTVGVDAQIVRIDLDLDLVRFGEHGDRDRRGVDPSGRLRRRHALHAMHP